VIERDRGIDVVGEKFVNETTIEIESGLVHLANTLGSTRGQEIEKTIRLKAEVSHEPHVALEPVIVVARDVASIAVQRLSGVWLKVSQMERPFPSA